MNGSKDVQILNDLITNALYRKKDSEQGLPVSPFLCHCFRLELGLFDNLSEKKKPVNKKFTGFELVCEINLRRLRDLYSAWYVMKINFLEV
jgi:hypothetical protein